MELYLELVPDFLSQKGATISIGGQEYDLKKIKKEIRKASFANEVLEAAEAVYQKRTAESKEKLRLLINQANVEGLMANISPNDTIGAANGLNGSYAMKINHKIIISFRNPWMGAAEYSCIYETIYQGKTIRYDLFQLN